MAGRLIFVLGWVRGMWRWGASSRCALSAGSEHIPALITPIPALRMIYQRKGQPYRRSAETMI